MYSGRHFSHPQDHTHSPQTTQTPIFKFSETLTLLLPRFPTMGQFSKFSNRSNQNNHMNMVFAHAQKVSLIFSEEVTQTVFWG